MTDDAGELVAFLVVEGGEPAWAVAIEHVETVLDAGSGGDAVDAAELGAPADATFPRRVLRLRSRDQVGALCVRGKLGVVTIARADIHALPALVAAHMRAHAFLEVAVRDDRVPFLIMDVQAALARSP
ncbi:MAG TPA: hypothetical protein VFQ53_15230 [Kofleriaceae bacterium]|nr:hypothetical protein [Kofleriaceae bacterium]